MPRTTTRIGFSRYPPFHCRIACLGNELAPFSVRQEEGFMAESTQMLRYRETAGDRPDCPSHSDERQKENAHEQILACTVADRNKESEHTVLASCLSAGAKSWRLLHEGPAQVVCHVAPGSAS